MGAGNILLAESESPYNLIGLLIFVAIGIIGAILKKASEQREQREEKQRAEQHRQRLRETAARSPQAPAVREEPPQARPGIQRQPSRQQLRPQPVVDSQAKARRLPQQPVPQVGPVAVPAPRRREVSLQQEPRQRKPRRTLTPRKTPTAEPLAGELGTIRPQVESAPDAAAAAGAVGRDLLERVRLHEPDLLRRAIVYHEIFSVPKALREGEEMWEM